MKNEIKETVTVNSQVIECPIVEGKPYVSIRHLCMALGTSYSRQLRKVKNDDILSSVVVLLTTTGIDKKKYEMVCLPLEFTFGWLFTISGDKVKPEIRESLKNYKMECYQALYNMFIAKNSVFVVKDEVLREKLENYEALRTEIEYDKSRMKLKERRLKETEKELRGLINADPNQISLFEKQK